jgi:hypothetical protein
MKQVWIAMLLIMASAEAKDLPPYWGKSGMTGIEACELFYKDKVECMKIVRQGEFQPAALVIVARLNSLKWLEHIRGKTFDIQEAKFCDQNFYNKNELSECFNQVRERPDVPNSEAERLQGNESSSRRDAEDAVVTKAKDHCKYWKYFSLTENLWKLNCDFRYEPYSYYAGGYIYSGSKPMYKCRADVVCLNEKPTDGLEIP